MIPFKRILFPTDFSGNSQSARDYACEFAHEFGAQLHVLSVVQDAALVLPETGMFLTLPMPSVKEILDAAEESLRSVLDRAWVVAHDVVLQVAVGTPFLEIIRYADEHQIDLIVMGTHGRTGMSHLMLGSVAERVLHKSLCPVLTIRSAEMSDNSPSDALDGRN